MATCTYTFQTAQGPITIKGQAEFKAYLASQGVESILPATLMSNRRSQTETPEFKRWAGTDTPVIPGNEVNDTDFSGPGPFVMQAFHGTTHSFSVFDALEKGNKEGQFGAVNYFTSSEQDASDNYAGVGPDLTSRLENLRERLEQDFESLVDDGASPDDIASEINRRYEIDLQAQDVPRVDNELDGPVDPYALASDVAQRVLNGGEEIVMEVYVKTERPFVAGDPERSPWFEFFDEAQIEAQALERVADNEGPSTEDIEADRDSYEDALQDARYEIMDEQENPLIAAVQTVADRYDFDPSAVLTSLYDVTADGSVKHSRLEDDLRHLLDRSYVEDPDSGALISSHVLAEVIQELGFDSIILKNADRRFRNMNMEPGTAHIHVFDANNTNIKSATDNNGQFDPENPDIRYSNRRAPTFFSQLGRAIDEAKMETMPGKQWSAWLLSNAGKLGIKKDEIQWTGITDWLSLQDGKVSKADIRAYLDSEGVQVEETMLGDAPRDSLTVHDIAQDQTLFDQYYTGKYTFDELTFTDRVRLLERNYVSDQLALDRSDDATKYSEYSVPGGENYKELLLTLPERSRPSPDFMAKEMFGQPMDKLLPEYRAQVRARLAEEGQQSYKSSHWDEPNILAHVRFDERTDADGKRVLFLNEIQSDWGQEGKKKGFIQRYKESDVEDVPAGREGAQDDIFWYFKVPGNELQIPKSKYPTREAARKYILTEKQTISGATVPMGPFVTDTKAWVPLAIKRMLRYAVDNGFDKVAFINGQQAADLYDLSKQINMASAMANKDGTYQLILEDKSGNEIAGYDRSGKKLTAEQMEDTVGKELAKKLIEGADRNKDKPWPKNVSVNPAFFTLRGLDLKVGGEGMRAFYDQIVPQVANDVLKKLGGGKVEQSRIATGDDDQYMANLIREKNPDYGLTVQNAITITPEMAAKISSGLPLFSNRRKPGSGSKFALPEESAYDARVRTWQNDQVRWKRQMAAVRDRGGVVNEQNDVYQAMERMIARAMNRTEDFYAKTVTPILKEMKDASITIDALGQYLYARHAKERNAYIAEINPAFANTAYDEVGGSGMSDQEADEIIARVQADPQAADYDRFAEAFRGWAEANLDGLVQGGLLSQEQADSMRERFPNYVPLRGFEAEDDEAGIFGQGAGFSTSKRLFQRTLGRRTKADNPASYIIHQVAEGMLAREKANVGRYLERLVADNPDDKLWTIGEPDKEPVMGHAPLRYELMLDGKEVDTFNTKTQAQQYKQLMNLKGATIEETGGEPQVMQRDLGYDPEKEVRFIRDGKQVRIQLKDPLLARAYNNGGAAEMGVLLQASASINAFLREMWTQKNPVFPLVNMLRDVPSAMLYAAGEMPGLATSMPKYLHGAWKAMYSQAKGEKIEGEWGPWVTEYRKAGGGIGFRMVGDIQSTMDRINRIEKKLGRAKILEALREGQVKLAGKRVFWRIFNNALTDLIERINQAFENMSRLAIYRASREQGASVAEASRMAKNATVNFNRRGEMTNNINSLYLFANAAIQDLAKNKRSVMDAPGKAKVGAALAGVATLGMMLGFFADDDDDLIDENMNVNAIRLTVGDKTVSLPLSYGLIGFAHYLGRSIAKVAKGEDIGMQSLRLASALLTNALPINPIPNPDKVDVANTVIGVAPTAIEFPLQVALNRNAFGSMMMPDYNNDPDAYKTFRGTRGTIYADVAAFLNESTGGDKRQSGWIDISPETLKGIVHFTLGGTGKFVADSFTSATNLLGGSSANQNSVPVLNRFVKQNDATVYRARFYRQAMEAKDKLELYNEYRKDGDMAKAREFSRWVPVGRTGNKLWKQMNALRDQELKAKDQLTGAALDARLRELDEKQVALSNRFFEIYKKAAAPKSAPSR